MTSKLAGILFWGLHLINFSFLKSKKSQNILKIKIYFDICFSETQNSIIRNVTIESTQNLSEVVIKDLELDNLYVIKALAKSPTLTTEVQKTIFLSKNFYQYIFGFKNILCIQKEKVKF